MSQIRKSILIPLALSLVFYGCLFLVRANQQLLLSSGSTRGDFFVAGPGTFTFSLTADQLRWSSYLLWAAISAGFLWAIYAVRSYVNDEVESPARGYLKYVILPYCLLGLATLAFYPHTSRPMDTVDYTVHARRQIVYGSNPYVVAGSEYSGKDPLVRYMEAKNRPSVYGPAWQFLSILPAVVGAGQLLTSIISFKVYFFLGGFGCLWLISLLHSQFPSKAPSLLVSGVLVAWNPILHLISHGEGHNDIAMAFFVAAALAALAFNRMTLSIIGWGLSVLVKFITAPFFLPLVLAKLNSSEGEERLRWIKSILIGLAIVAIFSVVLVLPFGSSALAANVSGRYSGLIGAAGDSKISVAANAASRIMSLFGNRIAPSDVAPLIGIAFPVSWGLYTLIRSLSVHDVESCARVMIESMLFYLTFVSVPVYAQYAVTLVIIVGFLSSGRWHRFAVVAVSLALSWDSLFIVFQPQTPPAWEVVLHQSSHLVAIVVFLAYCVARVPVLMRQALAHRGAQGRFVEVD